MTAFNVVRFRVRPGCEDRFLEAHRELQLQADGFLRGALVHTGERSYCMIGEWESFDRIVAARPQMIRVLDTMRDLLEDLGGGLGVTDPVSGEAVLEFTGR
jgi:quinol monooxygenase YgiN